jgi:site-specific recombinase XerD
MFNPTNVDRFVAQLRINGASDNTVRAYRNDLSMAMAICRLTVKPEDCEVELARWLNSNRVSVSPKSIQRRLSTWRSFARFMGEPILVNYVGPRVPEPTPHPIPEGIDGVLRMIKSTRNPKHRALCALTGLLGLRVNEAINVRPEDFRQEVVTIDGVATTVRILRVVYGKGDRQRDVPVSESAWTHIARQADRTPPGVPLVEMTNRGARAAISRHARNAGLSRHVSSHDMRATLATAAYDKTKDLRAVQEILGHADSKTTQIYTHISTANKVAAMAVV